MGSLGFSVIANKKETGFVEKIWRGLIDNDLSTLKQFDEYFYLAMNRNAGTMKAFPEFKKVEAARPKIHTMRANKKKYWKEGSTAFPVIFNRTKYRFQFCPRLEIKKVQSVEIRPLNNTYKSGATIYHVYIDTAYFGKYEENNGITPRLKQFIYNDGFDRVEDFFKWFQDGGTFDLLHWTRKIY